MATADVNVTDNVTDVAKFMTIDVKLRGLKQFQFRMGIVLLLFHLASWVSPVQIIINPED